MGCKLCNEPEGTNKECERCRLIAEIAFLKRLPTAITSENAESRIREAIHTIIHNWSEWDADAGQIAQQEQDPDAYDAAMSDQIGSVLTGMVFDSDPDSFDDGTVYVSPLEQKHCDEHQFGPWEPSGDSIGTHFKTCTVCGHREECPF